MPDELPVPPQALNCPSVEMIRLWLANKKLHCALNVGFWEQQGQDELDAWGILLADMIHHIANAHAIEYGKDREESIYKIRESFEREMERPTSQRVGEFVKGGKKKKSKPSRLK